MTQTSSDQVEFFSDPVHHPFSLGSGSPGSLLIHGFAGTPAEMRPLAEQLSDRHMSTTGILLPGFGPDIAALRQTSHTAWLDAARQAWHDTRSQNDQAILIGYSMGGAVAVLLAAESPPDALILVAPFSGMSSWLFKSLAVLKYVVPAWRPFRDANFDDPDVRAQLQGMMPGLDIDDPATRDFLRKEVSLPLSALDELRRTGAAAAAAAPEVTSPSLIIQGSADETVTPESSRALADRLGGHVTYHEMEAGHDLIRHPSLFMPLVDSFLYTRMGQPVG